MIRFDLIPQMASLFEDSRGFSSPNVDISENDDNYKLSFELPGALKDDVKIWVEDDVLTVSGEKKRSIGQDDVSVLSERTYGRFQRSFRFPRDVDKDNIKAEFVNGVLEVTIPKSEEAKPKEISIQIK